VLEYYGEETTCYLSGRHINLSEPRTYHFDHIIPVSKGGKNTLDNLGICIKEANIAKNSLTVDKFIELCQMVIDNKNR